MRAMCHHHLISHQFEWEKSSVDEIEKKEKERKMGERKWKGKEGEGEEGKNQ